MPDVWTKHPDIVRDLLKDAGFKCGVEGRFLQGRDPAWTCVYDGKTIKGDLYIHHADKLRSELRVPDDPLGALAMLLPVSILGRQRFLSSSVWRSGSQYIVGAPPALHSLRRSEFAGRTAPRSVFVTDPSSGEYRRLPNLGPTSAPTSAAFSGCLARS